MEMEANTTIIDKSRYWHGARLRTALRCHICDVDRDGSVPNSFQHQLFCTDDNGDTDQRQEYITKDMDSRKCGLITIHYHGCENNRLWWHGGRQSIEKYEVREKGLHMFHFVDARFGTTLRTATRAKCVQSICAYPAPEDLSQFHRVYTRRYAAKNVSSYLLQLIEVTSSWKEDMRDVVLSLNYCIQKRGTKGGKLSKMCGLELSTHQRNCQNKPSFTKKLRFERS